MIGNSHYFAVYALLLIVTIAHGKRSKDDARKANDDAEAYTYEFNTFKEHPPTGIFTSPLGDIVIAGDENGWVYRSSDYGASFTSSKALPLGDNLNTHASIYGCAMSLSGEKIVNQHAWQLSLHRFW